ncbi:MAG: hypothetical protein RL283_883 [Actinomycetota bacterium]
MLDHPEFARLARDHGWDASRVLDHRDGLLWCRTARPVDTAYADARQAARDEALATSWWYRTRNAMILDLLDATGRPAALWDVGAGTGAVSRALVATGLPTIALEPSPAGARFTAAHGLASVVGTLEALALPDAALPAIGLFDVLEHVEDRPALLGEIRRVLRPGAPLVLSVPAGSWLWSGFDVEERHQLRYSRDGLVDELRIAGFATERVVHAFALLTAPIWLTRALPHRLGRGTRTDHERAVRASGGPIGGMLSLVERGLAGRVPFGSSLLAVARTPG